MARELFDSVEKTAPAFIPTIAWIGGLLWAMQLGQPPIGFSALGLALSLAWVGHRGALTLIAFFAALLVAAAPGDGAASTLEKLAFRSVEVRGRAVGHADGEGERVFLLETSSLRFRDRVYAIETDLLIVLGREDSEERIAVDWGDELTLRGLLLAPSKARNGVPAWPGLYRLRVKSDRLAEITGRGAFLDRLAAELRRQAELGLGRWSADPRAAGFLRCLLLGDRSELPDEWARALNAVGLGHALSVSGFHISLFFLIAWGLTSFLGPRWRWWRLALVAVLLLGYLLLVGPRPAALRAGIMGLSVLVALMLERPTMALNTLAISALLLTLFRPQLVADLGFQLTVLATFGIVASSLVVSIEGPPWKRLLAAGFGAELMTLPLLLPRTGIWHPLGFLFNFLAGPWLGLLIGLGFLYLLTAALVAPAAPFLAQLFALLCRPLDLLGDLEPSRLFTVPVPQPGLLGWLAPLVALALIFLPRQTSRALLLVALAATSGVPGSAPPRLEVAFIDVGQGDATLLIDGDRALLVDGGGWRRGDPAGRLLVPALVRLGIGRLSAVALSHGDLDHCGGLAALAAYWPVDELWASSSTVATGCGSEVKSKAPSFRPLAAGEKLSFGRWSISVLWPEDSGRAEGNDGSLVLRAAAPGGSVLLTGDIEKGTEQALLKRRPTWLAADVLKVAHHGSRSSSTPRFLAAVKPRWAIVSAGEGNSFGHPAPEVVERLRRDGGCRLLRTDRHGLIRLHLPQGGLPWRLQLAETPTPPPAGL